MTLNVSRAELAEWLSVDPSRINQLVKEGVLQVERRGIYDAKKCVMAYIKYKNGGEGEETQEKRLTATDATVRLKVAQAIKVELENAVNQKKLLHQELVLQYLEEMITVFTNDLEALDGRLTGELAGELEGVSRGRIAEIIQKEVNFVRTNLSNSLASLADQFAPSEFNQTDTD
jgi:phage terminase Nu1 subunit (DNA packaging protein)